MKNTFKYSLLAVVALSLGSCHSPEEPVFSVANTTGITSLSARFLEGNYSSDPNAVFTATVSDPNQSEIIIEIPWFYPETSDNQVTDITKMRVTAATEPGTIITPALGVMDLTKSHTLQVQLPNGNMKQYKVRGALTKLSGTDIDALTITDEFKQRYDAIIDNEARTIVVGAIDEVLQGCTITSRLSPHATLTAPDLSEPIDIAPGDIFTVTAHNGTTADYTVEFRIPEKVRYGMRPGSEKKMFMKYFSTDYGMTVPAGTSTRLAVQGSNLLVACGDKILVVDRFSGDKIEEIASPTGTAIHSLVSDSAGHVLIAGKAGNGEHLKIYRMDSLTETPQEIIDFANTVPYVLESGNVRVVGNIDNNAVITAIAAAYSGATTSPSYIAWPVVDGVIGEPEIGSIATAGQLWTVANAAAIGASSDLNDGIFSSGYYGVYHLYYYDPYTNGWSIAVNTDGLITSNDNPCALSMIEFNGARYIALIKGAHFTWSFVEIFMYDASNVSTMNEAQVFHMPSDVIMSSSIASNNADDSFSDVLLFPSEDGYKFSLYFIDHNWDVMGSYEFDCIKK